MNATVSEIDDEKKTIRIEADWNEVSADYEDAYLPYRNVSLPGFRPGKIPRSVIENRFHKEICASAGKRSATRLTRDALREKQLRTAGGTAVVEINFERGKAFSCVAEFVLRPQFELPDYSNMEITETEDEKQRDQITDWLLEKVSFPIADSLVSCELSEEEADAKPGSEAWTDAEKRARALLILHDIAENEGIEVSDVSIEQRIVQTAHSIGAEPHALREHLAASGGLTRLRDFMLAEATLTYLLEKNTKNQK